MMIQVLGAQVFSAYPRHSFYIDESTIELLLQYPANQVATHLKIANKTYPIVGQKVRSVIIPFNEIGAQSLVQLYNANRKIAQTTVHVNKLVPKANAVRIDYLNGTLQVEGLPFYPFGFYTYSPLQPNLIPEEAIRAFNLISPYQKNNPENLVERIAYLDQAHQHGIKVNYHLTALAGGGGVNMTGQKLTWDERKTRLQAEIEAIKDHPALLSYYLADEPSARNVNADTLALFYKIIKEKDPYHPIAMVFNETQNVEKYANSFDILMTDPYPIPDKPVTEIATFLQELGRKFAYKKPIWLVPQTFGGGEWWKREPTLQELRAMVYLGLVNGATGMQAFIRQSGAFPKSIEVWNEYGRIAREVQSLVPFFSQEEIAEPVNCNEPQVQLKTWQYNGEMIIIAVNTTNEPVNPAFTLPASVQVYTEITLPFENRSLLPQDNVFNDVLTGFGTKVYRFKIGRSLQRGVKLSAENLIVDGGFEAETNPLTPDAVYFEAGATAGATAFIEGRTAIEGAKSLRMQTPTVGNGLNVLFYPTEALANQHYALSIYGKGSGQFKLGIRYQTEAVFDLKGTWQKFMLPFRPTENYRYNAFLNLQSNTTAWFDAVELVPDPQITRKINEQGEMQITLSTAFLQGQIWYQLGNEARQLYQVPITVSASSPLQVQVWEGENLLSQAAETVNIHKALGKKVTYLSSYAPDYPSTGENALTDGNEGNTKLKNKAWQGFFGEDATFIIDLGQNTEVNRIKVNALQDWYSWVLAPKSMSVVGIADLNNVVPIVLGEIDTAQFAQSTTLQKVPLHLNLSNSAVVRYLQFNIHNQKILPVNHPGAGTKAWLFIDEVVVE